MKINVTCPNCGNVSQPSVSGDGTLSVKDRAYQAYEAQLPREPSKQTYKVYITVPTTLWATVDIEAESEEKAIAIALDAVDDPEQRLPLNFDLSDEPSWEEANAEVIETS